MKQSVRYVICSATIFSMILLVHLSAVRADDKPAAKKIIPRPAAQKVTGGTYKQQVRTNFSADSGLPEAAVKQLAFDQKPFVATDKGIFSFDGTRWQPVISTSSPVACLAVSGNKVLYVQDNQVSEFENGTSAPIAAVPQSAQATSVVKTDKSIYVGTGAGLFTLEGKAFAPVMAVNQLLTEGLEIRQIASHGGEIVVAAKGGLVSYSEGSKQAKTLVPRAKSAGWALSDVRGVAFNSKGGLWFASPQGVGLRSGNEWTLYTGDEGLPYNDFTCVAAAGEADVWFGTHIGAIRFTGKQWEYRQGQRWLADDDVISIAVAPSGDAWFGTKGGVTRIESRSMTLKEKSAFLNSEIEKYHRRTPYGYVDGRHLEKVADKANGTQHDSDNDGLWTSMYGAGQCFEYAVTRSAESKKRANDAFRAVAFLSEVPQGGKHSPPVGFPARSILPTSGSDPNTRDNAKNDERHRQSDPLWKVLSPRWPVSADGKWYWKTDTSSDELDGHYYFYALYYDLVAETEEEKKNAKAVVERVTNHLIDHDYMLIDHDGNPTRWGQFSPKVLNTDVLTDCRGLNSLSILSYLKVAQHVTGDEKYARKYKELLFDHNYYTNVLTPKYQNGPGSGNQSDDEMAFMCYYSLLTYEDDPKLRKQYMRSFARYFTQEEPEVCPLFSLTFAALYEPVRDHWNEVPLSVVQDSLETLQRYPLDRIHWGYKNSHRLDIVPLGPHIEEYQGKGHLRNGKVLPIDERYVNHWNVDPWRLNGGHRGTELSDGASFLLPYWLGVHHGLIVE